VTSTDCREQSSCPSNISSVTLLVEVSYYIRIPSWRILCVEIQNQKYFSVTAGILFSLFVFISIINVFLQHAEHGKVINRAAAR
jgi:hypothetical protein